MPAAHAYGIGKQEPTWILSGNSAPSAHTTEIGARLGDVIGRLDTIAVASLGDIRGATIATRWRGWPIAIGAQAYTARERKIGKQHGLELRASWDAVYPMHDIAASAGVLRTSPFITARLRFRQRDFTERIAIAKERGHARAFARVEARLGAIKLGAEAQRDQHALVGGIASTILPLSAVANRVLDPALDPATLRGSRYTGARADLSLAGLTLFYRQHRMNERLNVEGVEVARRMPAMPLLKAPALDITAGVARVEHRTRGWIGVRLSP